MSINLLQKRSLESVSDIINSVKNYLIFLDNKKHNYFKLYSKHINPTYNKSRTVQPKHVTIEEFEKIVDEIDNSLTSESALKLKMVIELMFNSSLRVGEVLGLTVEDICSKQVNGKRYYFVIIRNRLTDKQDQLAKSCMNILSEKSYHTNAYFTQNVGFQIAYITKSLFDSINNYIEFTHNKYHHRKDYTLCKADIVSSEDLIFGNRYVFINDRVPSPLSRKWINNTLRDIFIRVGLEVDVNRRHNNLTHRMRHGFIMKLLYREKIPVEHVIVFSRHKTIKSLEPYNNLSEEAMISHYESFENYIGKIKCSK